MQKTEINWVKANKIGIDSNNIISSQQEHSQFGLKKQITFNEE
jgi:hypothetical protein